MAAWRTFLKRYIIWGLLHPPTGPGAGLLPATRRRRANRHPGFHLTHHPRTPAPAEQVQPPLPTPDRGMAYHGGQRDDRRRLQRPSVQHHPARRAEEKKNNLAEGEYLVQAEQGAAIAVKITEMLGEEVMAVNKR